MTDDYQFVNWQAIRDAYYSGALSNMPDNGAGARFQAANPNKNFWSTERGQKMLSLVGPQGKRRDTFLWRPLVEVLKRHGKRDNIQYQRRGTCVGQGTKRLIDQVLAMRHLFLGDVWEGRAAVAGTYAGGRVEIGNSPSRSDGSNCEWSCAWLTKGILLLKDIGLDDAAEWDDEKLAVDWAASRQGVPAEFEQIARKRRSMNVVPCRSPDELEALIDNWVPAVTCGPMLPGSNRGQYGVMTLRRGGGHCELIDGKFWINGRRYWHRQNSWSEESCDGPRYPDDMPAGSYNLTDEDIATILRTGSINGVAFDVAGFENANVDPYDFS